jgi:PAS domain S-box-containing protein
VEHAEAALVAGSAVVEDRFEPLARVAPIGIFECDLTGCGTCLRSARHREAIARLSLLALQQPTREALFAQAVIETTALGAPVEIVDADGLVRAVSLERKPLDALDQHFVQSIGHVLSAWMQRERAEARSSRRERWLRAYFEHSPDLVFRLAVDATIIEVNPAAARVLGIPLALLRGRGSEMLGLSDRALATWCIAVEQVYRSRREHSLDLAMDTANGERMYAARLTAVLDESDQVEFVGAILQDVTERARAEQRVAHLQREILEREDRLQRLLQSFLGERAMLRERVRTWGLAALTPREQTILRLMANGRTNREIASELGMGAGTVKNRISLLLPKLGAADRTQAVAIALQLGLLASPAASREEETFAPPVLREFNLGEFE